MPQQRIEVRPRKDVYERIEEHFFQLESSL
jgi:hypothetical protein